MCANEKKKISWVTRFFSLHTTLVVDVDTPYIDHLGWVPLSLATEPSKTKASLRSHILEPRRMKRLTEIEEKPAICWKPRDFYRCCFRFLFGSKTHEHTHTHTYTQMHAPHLPNFRFAMGRIFLHFPMQRPMGCLKWKEFSKKRKPFGAFGSRKRRTNGAAKSKQAFCCDEIIQAKRSSERRIPSGACLHHLITSECLLLP